MARARVLHGLKEIATFLGCTEKRVRSLERAGAPIRVTGKADGRRYLADVSALRTWLRGDARQPAAT